MPTPPKLTEVQKRRLRILEPQLRQAALDGNLEIAKSLLTEIQSILAPTGHTARLMQNKNWLFEAAMEAGSIEFAIQGFIGVRGKVSPRTRTFQEATVMLAICYLRNNNLEVAKPLISQSLLSTNIQSKERRRLFLKALIQRFEEEMILATIRGKSPMPIKIEEVSDGVSKLVSSNTIDSIYSIIGDVVPPEVARGMRAVHDYSREQLPYEERAMLPAPPDTGESRKLGERVFKAITKHAWRAICDPSSEVYKLWHDNGFQAIFNKHLITAAIVGTLNNMKFGVYVLAVAISALVFRLGLDVFCDLSRPRCIMEERAK